jgi:dihydroxy-acid dehydratase
MLKSQKSRALNPEIDPLLLGTGWAPEDLAKPQILLESTFGDSHPGSKQLNRLVDDARAGVLKSGGKPAVYSVTDICDGVTTGHDGMNYSLLSRDMISGMVEIHARSMPFDGMITISSCDKAIPAHLMAIARLNIPSLHVSGGSMMPGPGFSTAVTCYESEERNRRREISAQESHFYKVNACAGCGACQYMGTASTMQVMAEALGLSLPANALMPAWSNRMAHLADRAGRTVMQLLEKNICAADILSHQAFENAITLHAAVSGSTNALLHLPAIAAHAGITITPQDFDRIHKKIPVLAGLQMSGPWPTQIFWYAGGVPGVMRILKDYLHLDALTITGKSLGDNLIELEGEGFFEQTALYLKNYKIKPEMVIQPLDDPYKPGGGLRILCGNLAPQGAVIKHAAVTPEMHRHMGPAKPFDSEEAAIEAIQSDQILAGDVVVIRYEGPRGSGMPEMFRTTEVLHNHVCLRDKVALVTDGRFSGATRGPAVGHVMPEAARGGPLALVKEDDLISIDIAQQKLELVGFAGDHKSGEEVEQELYRRADAWQGFEPKQKGLLGLYANMAADTQKGASMIK